MSKPEMDTLLMRMKIDEQCCPLLWKVAVQVINEWTVTTGVTTAVLNEFFDFDRNCTPASIKFIRIMVETRIIQQGLFPDSEQEHIFHQLMSLFLSRHIFITTLERNDWKEKINMLGRQMKEQFGKIKANMLALIVSQASEREDELEFAKEVLHQIEKNVNRKIRHIQHAIANKMIYHWKNAMSRML